MIKNEIKEKIPLNKIKKTKYSGINLTREAETLQSENYKTLLELPDVGSQSLGEGSSLSWGIPTPVGQRRALTMPGMGWQPKGKSYASERVVAWCGCKAHKGFAWHAVGC